MAAIELRGLPPTFTPSDLSALVPLRSLTFVLGQGAQQAAALAVLQSADDAAVVGELLEASSWAVGPIAVQPVEDAARWLADRVLQVRPAAFTVPLPPRRAAPAQHPHALHCRALRRLQGGSTDAFCTECRKAHTDGQRADGEQPRATGRASSPPPPPSQQPLEFEFGADPLYNPADWLPDYGSGQLPGSSTPPQPEGWSSSSLKASDEGWLEVGASRTTTHGSHKGGAAAAAKGGGRSSAGRSAGESSGSGGGGSNTSATPTPILFIGNLKPTAQPDDVKKVVGR
jgi:hypothetical protein